MMSIARIYAVIVGLLVMGTGVPQIYAQSRRALLVGINQYQLHPSGDRVPNLDGAVADVEAMASLLQTLHGFRAEDIKILRDQEASRAAILATLESHLEKSAKPGDLALFYYAGHGSYVENAASEETDKRDETILPADSNSGAADIRDKELAQRFHRILDQQAQLVAVFDSCHSGSIARGLPELVKNRFAPPGPSTRGHPVDTLPKQSVEERGGLILSAAQEHQPAQEKRIRGQSRGRFTSALEHVLAGPYRDESVERFFLRIRAIMQSGGSVQEPVLGASVERRKRSLWGQQAASGLRLRNMETGDGQDGHMVAVSRVLGSRIHLQAGIASGLGVQAVLSKSRDPQGTRLRVLEVTGMASCVAEVLSGDASNISPGDLFEIQDYGIPRGDGLKVLVPSLLPSAQDLAQSVKLWSSLLSDPKVHPVSDPTEESPTHFMMWEAGKWQLRDPTGKWIMLGAQPNLKLVRKILREAPSARLFVNIPPSRELAEKLREQLMTSRSFIQIVEDAASASYHLVGRLTRSSTTSVVQLEHALILPNAERRDQRASLPARSAWLPADTERLPAGMTVEARRINKVLLWRSRDSPPTDDSFPYKLAVLDLDTGRVLSEAEPLRIGKKYQLAMVADAVGPRIRPRYVYIFSLDREGSCALMVPLSDSSNVENYVPDVRAGSGPASKQIVLGSGFSVSPPFGRDMLVLVTSVTPIATPSAFCADNERRAVSPMGNDPLTQFLFGINRDTRAQSSVPATWSLQRLTVDSVEK